MDPPAMISGTFQFMFSMDQVEVIFGANDFWPHIAYFSVQKVWRS
jgi:hypothetical protein